jgi:methylphosphotriester-DNA--protein-cysteine methyltransferase
MIPHQSLSKNELQKLIRNRRISFAGNQKLKIYGILQCASGKRMKKTNRVFFGDEKEATFLGYRPCGHCLSAKYRLWKIKLK